MTAVQEIDKRIAVLEWYRDLKETNNDPFLPLFFDQHRYLVLKGGGGSGKSIFAGRKILERCVSEELHRFLVCRKVAKTLRQSCWKQLVSQANQFYRDEIESINKSDMVIRFKNGSEILFAGLDDVEKLKSIFGITGIWIEEASEILETDFDQLDIRLRGTTKYYKQIIISFNPVSLLHWLKRRFFDRKDERVRISETTYRDNKFLDEESKDVLEAFKETDWYYYTVYCLGQWGVTGKTVFDAKLIQRMLEKDLEPVRTGEFTFRDDGLRLQERAFQETENGFIKIYEEPKPGWPYVLAGDTAGEGSDWFVGTVIDNVNGRIVAKLRHQTDEDLYARQMICLGWYYNEALIGVEVNFSSFPQKEMQRLGYTRFYVREVEDDFTGKVRTAFGFKTTNLTRPVVIAGLIQLVRSHPECIRDRDTLEEMLTFVRNEQGRPEAENGAHDDCVMAAAIAYYIREQQSMAVPKQEQEKKKWTQDMWEDYRSASAEVRAYLRQKWGDPQ